MDCVKRIKELSLCLLVMAAVLATGGTALAQDETTVAEQLETALGHYNDLNYEKGIELAKALLERSNLTADDSVAIYEVLGIITYARGETYFQQAFRYLDKISEIGPCVVPMPRDLWPQELRDHWYAIVNERGELTCEEPKENVKTIAIMPFDNYSVGDYQEKLGQLNKALSDFFTFDFAQISDFSVVDRDKLDWLMQEHELAKTGVVDQSTAVRAGKMLSARYMVFGSITQLDRNQARMIVRVVNVETSEIIVQADREGRPEFASMTAELVIDIAEQLDMDLSEETIGMIEAGGTDDYDAATLYSLGLDYMDQYDYKKAYEHFKKAYEKDESFVEAKRKMEIYRPLAG